MFNLYMTSQQDNVLEHELRQKQIIFYLPMWVINDLQLVLAASLKVIFSLVSFWTRGG